MTYSPLLLFSLAAPLALAGCGGGSTAADLGTDLGPDDAGRCAYDHEPIPLDVVYDCPADPPDAGGCTGPFHVGARTFTPDAGPESRRVSCNATLPFGSDFSGFCAPQTCYCAGGPPVQWVCPL